MGISAFFLNVQLLGCHGVGQVYGQVKGRQYICHWYMCILLYVKLIGCNGVA